MTSVRTNRDLWSGMKMLLVIAGGVLIVSNTIFAIQALDTGTGAPWNSQVVDGGQLANGPGETIHHNGFWYDAGMIALFVVVDAALIAFWYRLISKIRWM